MKPGWEGVIVPSKLYGILKTEAPVLFVGPEDADTSQEIRRLRRGKVLPIASDGRRLLRPWMSWSGSRERTVRRRGGIAKIAEYLVGAAVLR